MVPREGALRGLRVSLGAARILVVVNKIDKPAARPDYVIDKTFDLFVELGAPDAS